MSHLVSFQTVELRKIGATFHYRSALSLVAKNIKMIPLRRFLNSSCEPLRALIF